VTGLDDDLLATSLRELGDRLDGTQIEPLGTRLGTVVSAAADLLGVESIGLLLLDDTDRIRSVASTGPAARVLELAHEKVVVGPGVDALNGEMLAVTDLAAEPRYAVLWREVAGHGVRAVLAAPVRLGELVVGNLNAVLPEPHAWTPAERRSAAAFAGIVGQLLGLAARESVSVTDRNGRSG